MADKNKKLDNVIETSIESLSQLVDVNTVVGRPITLANGINLIPVTKVTMGYLSGGGEYGEVKIIKETGNIPFAGGAGAIVNIKPCAFIIDDGVNCRLTRIGEDALDELIDKASEMITNYTDNHQT